MIIWIDTETTGLNPRQDKLLEIACVITDDDLEEVNRFQAVTNEARTVDFNSVDPYVLDMHFKNGLWHESLKANLPENLLYQIDRNLAAFIDSNSAGAKHQLGGSTISFDRGFIEYHLPSTNTTLHYRNVDVTSFNEVARRFWPEIHEKRPRNGETKHRALDDILESINVLRYYTKALVPRG